MNDTLALLELQADGGCVSCRLCRRLLRDAGRGLKQHFKALHPWVLAQHRKPIKPGMMVIDNPESRFASIVASHHHAPDGSWVSAIRECLRADGLPKKQFATKAEADRAARPLGRRYRGYDCSNGQFHVGRRYA